MHRTSRRIVFVIFGNAHKIAESLFWHLKKVWSYGKKTGKCIVFLFPLN